MRFPLRIPALMFLALAAATVLVVVLAFQNRALEDRYRAAVERGRQPHVGVTVPAFRAVTLEGDSVTIGEPAGRTVDVVFFFTTSCPHCRASLAAWQRIASAVAEAGWGTVIGIQLDSAHLGAAYVAEHELTFPVVPLSNRRLARLYRVTGVPLTMVVGADGRVRYVHKGRLDMTSAAADSVIHAVQMSATEADDGVVVGEGGGRY